MCVHKSQCLGSTWTCFSKKNRVRNNWLPALSKHALLWFFFTTWNLYFRSGNSLPALLERRLVLSFFFFQKKNHLLNLQVLEFLMSSIFLHSLASRIFQAQIRRYIDTLNSLLSLKTIVSIYLSSSIYLNKSTHQIRFTIKKMQAFVFPPFSQVGRIKTPGNFDEWLLGGAS